VQTDLYTLQLAQYNHVKFTTDMFLTHKDIFTTPRRVVAQNVTRLHEKQWKSQFLWYHIIDRPKLWFMQSCISSHSYVVIPHHSDNITLMWV